MIQSLTCYMEVTASSLTSCLCVGKHYKEALLSIDRLAFGVKECKLCTHTWMQIKSSLFHKMPFDTHYGDFLGNTKQRCGAHHLPFPDLYRLKVASLHVPRCDFEEISSSVKNSSKGMKERFFLWKATKHRGLTGGPGNPSGVEPQL